MIIILSRKEKENLPLGEHIKGFFSLSAKSDNLIIARVAPRRKC